LSENKDKKVSHAFSNLVESERKKKGIHYKTTKVILNENVCFSLGKEY